MSGTTDVRTEEGEYIGFRNDKGKLFLQRCPKCELENWAPAVASGKCAWCSHRPDNVKGEKQDG